MLSHATRPLAHLAVRMLATYAAAIVQPSLHVVQEGHGQSPPEVRARLAQPIVLLLRSPLLGLLASLQHVVIDSSASTNCWRFPESSDIPPMHLLPARMLPDAMDSEVALQVRHSLWVSHGCLHRLDITVRDIFALGDYAFPFSPCMTPFIHFLIP